MKLRTVLRESLLHFLLIGLAFFALYRAVVPAGSDSNRIVVSEARANDMARQYQVLWGRPPTTVELRGLFDTYVLDEIIFREANALGLDHDDAVIKRRVRQKYDLMARGARRPCCADRRRS